MNKLTVLILCLILGVIYSKEVFYHLVAQEIDWSYGLTGDGEGGQTHVNYTKAVFREKTDSGTEGTGYLGLLGPVIQTQVGDILKVKLENKLNHQISIHVIGVNPVNEDHDVAVEPGHSHVYTWDIAEKDGPGTDDPDCVTSLYYSDVDMVTDVNDGLVGMMSICRTELPKSKRQLFLLFNIFAEDGNTLKSDGNGTDSARFATVNGYSPGAMPSIDLCKDNDVILHMTGLGNDIHTVRVYGHSLTRNRKRHDSIIVYPGSTISAFFKPTENGRWLVSSQSNDLMTGGMRTYINIRRCPSSTVTTSNMSGTVRRFYLATEALQNADNQNDTILGFVPYRDRSFSVKATRPGDMSYLGTLGPLIIVEVGDIAKVVLKNKDEDLHTIHPHGLRTHKRNEGMFYDKDSTQVRQGQLKTYFWMAPESFGPTPYDLPCIPRYYTSGINTKEITDGLIGPMLVCQRGMLDFNGNKLSSAAKEFFLFITETSTGDDVRVNGLPCEQFQTLKFDRNEKVRIFALVLGGRGITVDIDGNPFVFDGSNTYVMTLYPGQIQSPEISTKQEGKWRIAINNYCAVKYIVGRENVPKDTNLPMPSVTHYIGIKEYTKKGIGGRSALKRYKFQGYRSDYYYWHIRESNNLLGPVIRGVVGRTIKIALQNENSAKIPFSMYSPGVVIRCENDDNNIVVEAGSTLTCLWTFPETSGPGSADQDCVARTYFSNVDKVKDVASGLIGPLIVCKDETAADKDIEAQSKVLGIGVFEESESWFYDEPEPNSVKEDYSVFAINGYANGSFPDMETGNDGFISLHLVNIGSRFHAIQFSGAVIVETSQRSMLSKNIIPLFPQSSSFVYLHIESHGQWRYEGMSYQDKEHLLQGIIRFEIYNPGPS